MTVSKIAKIGIVDYGINNLSSITKAFKFLEIDCKVIQNHNDLKNFSHLILPGVGSFSSGIKNLKNLNFYEEIINVVHKEKFLLGICLGMQLLFNNSQESNEDINGLGLIEGSVNKLKKNKDTSVPHVGWNSVEITSNSKLMNNIGQNSFFYFVHSFAVKPNDNSVVVGSCTHGDIFPAIVNKKNIYGVQFHPEKCHQNGLQIFKNFSLF